MAIDGFEWDAPATEANATEFGYAGSAVDTPAVETLPRIEGMILSG
jgi:hypothetical protein